MSLIIGLSDLIGEHAVSAVLCMHHARISFFIQCGGLDRWQRGKPIVWLVAYFLLDFHTRLAHGAYKDLDADRIVPECGAKIGRGSPEDITERLPEILQVTMTVTRLNSSLQGQLKGWAAEVWAETFSRPGENEFGRKIPGVRTRSAGAGRDSELEMADRVLCLRGNVFPCGIRWSRRWLGNKPRPELGTMDYRLDLLGGPFDRADDHQQAHPIKAPFRTQVIKGKVYDLP